MQAYQSVNCNSIPSHWQSVLPWCLVFVIVFNLVFLIGGRFHGGFQPMDDHEILAIPYRVSQTSLLSTLTGWLRDDLDLRFRPVYCIYRVLSSLCFNGNSRIAAIWTILLGNLFGLGLILVFSKHRYPPYIALLIPMICCFGPQTECWLLIGCQENLALLALVAVVWQVFRVVEKTTTANEILLIIAIGIMTGCKESFIPIVPALVWFRYMLEAEQSEDSSLKNLLLKNWYWKLLPFILIVLEIAFIKLAIPSHYTSDVGTSHSKLFYIAINTLYTLETGMGELLLFFMGMLVVYVIDNQFLLKKWIMVLVLILLGAGSQILGYACIHHRYMLPCIFFYAVGICEAIYAITSSNFNKSAFFQRRTSFLRFASILCVATALILILTYRINIANGKPLNEFLPIPVAGIVGSLLILSVGGVIWRYLPNRKGVAFALCLLYFVVRGNLWSSYSYVSTFMKGIRNWEVPIVLLHSHKPTKVLLVSDPEDTIGFEGQVFMHSLLKYRQQIDTKWVILGKTSKEIQQKKEDRQWGFYHQGKALADDLISEDELNQFCWDAAIVLDRMHNNIVEIMLAKYGFQNYQYTDEEKTIAVLW